MSHANSTAKPYQAKVFDTLLTARPITPTLDRVNSPADLKTLSIQELQVLADELRAFLLYSVGVSGGHFGANLGVVELTIALHTVFNTPYDKLVWDVGHQAYAHKILTGRREQLTTIRTKDGLTAFPERSESQYDTFGVGHSSTAISAGLGMSLASRYLSLNQKVACVVGDGAMTGGMAFEAMNDAVQQNADITVILNDNDMSISEAVGGFSKHLVALWQKGLAMDIDKHGNIMMVKRHLADDDRRIRHYLHMANDVLGEIGERLPAKVAEKISEKWQQGSLARTGSPLPDKIAEKLQENLFPDNLFKAIGFTYLGPFDGHDLPKLVKVLSRAKQLKGAVLVHVHTVKGKGFSPAEADPIGYHAIGKLPKPDRQKPNEQKSTIDTAQKPAAKKYSQVFGEFLLDKAALDNRLLAITPAMAEGSGMVDFAKRYPNRFFDVAIAEQHAITLAGGMAAGGADVDGVQSSVKPIVAIYSTFLQRGYDQFIHDVALQNLDVTFAIDRAGLVGEDGATHAGVFDLAYLRCVPNVIVATPSDENECYQLLNVCYEYQGVSAVRYPRGAGVGQALTAFNPNEYPIGKARTAWQSEHYHDTDTGSPSNSSAQSPSKPLRIAVLAFGTRLADAVSASQDFVQSELAVAKSVAITVIDMRWVKPLDSDMLDGLINNGVDIIITIEEHQRMGGAGSAVNEYLLNQHRSSLPSVINLGLDDKFIQHASHAEQLAMCGLDKLGIYHALECAVGIVD
ncbi:MAG: 1-deoxy-D-xylulose-5-phosphate synthase [Moraxella sp.]|nr:1-deoxy-D-xylulose-5-phosphate synthase [Moraxella sp.]